MATQWHPLFAHLLTILIKDYYTVEAEVPRVEFEGPSDDAEVDEWRGSRSRHPGRK